MTTYIPEVTPGRIPGRIPGRTTGPVPGRPLRSSHTEIAVTVGHEGARAHVRSRVSGEVNAPVLRPVLLGSGPTWARIALIAEGALLLAGDHVSLSVEVGPGVHLSVVEPSGVVAYSMRGLQASWSVDLDVRDGSALVWEGQPFVVAADAVVDRRTTVALAADARLLLREILVLGRWEEPSGVLRTSAEVTRDGVPVLLEDLRLGGTAPAPGILGDHRVLDAVLALGHDPVDQAGRLDLESGDHLYRALVTEAHQSELGTVWQHLERSQSVTEV